MTRFSLKLRHDALFFVVLALAAWVLLGKTAWAQAPAEEAETTFELPALRSGPTLSFQEAILRAHRQNRSLQAIRLDLETAAQNLKASWAVLLPNLYGSLGYTLNDHADTTTQNGVTVETSAQNQAAAGLKVSMPLIAAQRWLAIDAARVGERAAVLDVEQTSQALLYSVAEAYYQAAGLHRLLHVYEAQRKALSDHLASAKVRYRSGVGSLVDVLRARTDLVSVQDEQLKAVFALERARDALVVLLGSKEPPLPQENPPSLSEMDTTDKTSIETRWDVRAARQALELSKKNVKTQWMQFVPTLNAAWQWNYALTVPDTPQTIERDRWNLGLVLSVPLFDETFYPALAKTRIAENQAQLRLDYMEQEARKDQTLAERDLLQNDLLWTSAKHKVRLADDTLTIAQTNYVNGTGSALVVIDARRASQTAHVELETRRLDVELARLARLRAQGRDILTLVR